MTLGEFIKKRKEELNLKWKDFEDAGVSSQTISCIINNKQKSIMPATREKLANVLQVSQGDIQACMAEAPNPLRAEAERPEGNAGISITAKAKKKPKPENPAPDPEEPAEVFRPEAEDEPENIFNPDPDPETSLDDYLNTPFPEYKSVYEEDRLEGEERYKQKLRDMCLRIFATGVPGTHTMKDVYADIGYALVKELAGGAE